MSKTFLEQVYAVAADYAVSLETGYWMTKLQVQSLKNMRIQKTAIIHLLDMPSAEKRDEYLAQKLNELLEKIKAEE